MIDRNNKNGSRKSNGNKNNKSSFLSIISNRIITIIALFVMSTLLQYLFTFALNNGYKKENIITDFFSQQRMLAEKIPMESTRKYNLLISMENGTREAYDDELLGVISELNESLKINVNSFDSSLNSLLSGQLPNGNTILKLPSDQQADDILDKLKKNWLDYKNSVGIIISSNQTDQETINAIRQIDSITGSILKDINELNQIYISRHKSREKSYLILYFALFLIILISLVLTITQTYRQIIAPLNVLYTGISNLGLLNKKVQNEIPTKKEISPVINDLNEKIKKLRRLIKLIETISQSISFEDTLRFLYTSFAEFIPYSHIGIALLKEDGKILEATFGISDQSMHGLPQKLYGIRAELSNTSLGNVIEKGIPRVINDLESYVTDKSKSYNRILLDHGIKSSITLPLKLNNKPVGVIFFSSNKKDIYEEDHISFLETLSDSIAISLNKNIFIDELLFSTILALAKMAEARDEGTGNHLERMQKYSVKITEFLIDDKKYENELNYTFLRDIERFSPMHDIGKVGIRDYILLKPGKLTEEEYEEMKKHALYGAEVLKTAENNMLKHNRSLFKIGIEIAEGHHEKWDGTGYPYGKSGYDIPLSARIVAVADVFDALTSVRPYKKAFSFEDSINILLKGRGKHFDPNIIDSLIRHKDEFYSLYSTFSSNFDTEGN